MCPDIVKYVERKCSSDLDYLTIIFRKNVLTEHGEEIRQLIQKWIVNSVFPLINTILLRSNLFFFLQFFNWLKS